MVGNHSDTRETGTPPDPPNSTAHITRETGRLDWNLGHSGAFQRSSRTDIGLRDVKPCENQTRLATVTYHAQHGGIHSLSSYQEKHLKTNHVYGYMVKILNTESRHTAKSFSHILSFT